MRRRPVGDGLSALERLRLEQQHKTLRAAECAVLRAAMAWWDGKRPRGWSVVEHVDTPAVNCTTPSEVKMALACAKLAALTEET